MLENQSRPFVTPNPEVPGYHLQTKLAIFEHVRQRMLQIIDQLIEAEKEFEYHSITSKSSVGGLYINQVGNSAKSSRWQFIFSSKEQKSGPLMKIVLDRTLNVIESGFYRVQSHLRYFSDCDNAQLFIQSRAWHGLLNLLNSRNLKVIPSGEVRFAESKLHVDASQTPQTSQTSQTACNSPLPSSFSSPFSLRSLKRFDAEASLYGDLEPIPFIDDLINNLMIREAFLS